MTPDEWQSIKAALNEALDLDPGERARYLERCAPHIRREVESLIHAYEEADARSAQGLVLSWPGTSFFEGHPVGGSFGPYRTISVLGVGGMGTVWLAERADGLFKRQLALKLPHSPVMGRAMSERFTREREILASMSHPNIGRLLDAGITEEGQPYLALEYVAGLPITTYCDQQRLTVPQRLRLFQQVLSAVQYAHAHLVVHRDLKPSNILVTDEGQVRLLDFGIAKLLVEGEARETELTRLGGRALTPDYAAPEQILGAPITTATDIYALGILAYELLTGRRPYRLKHDSQASLEEAIVGADPIAPSRTTIGENAALTRSTTPKKLRVALKGDLDTIVCKALQKLPSARYATADAFAEDIGRFLRAETVLARRPSWSYRTLRFARRHRLGIGVCCALLITLLAGFAATLYEARLAAIERDTALQAQASSLVQTAAARLRGGDVAGALGIILEVLSRQRSQHSYTPQALGVFQEARAADAQLLALEGHEDRLLFASFSPDGHSIVTASNDHTARVWNAATGREQRVLAGHADIVDSAVFSPDGRRVLTGSYDKSARLWDAVSGAETLRLNGHDRPVMSALFSSDGLNIVTASTDRTARVWDAASGRALVVLKASGRLTSAAFSPDGKHIIGSADDRTARIWDVNSQRELLSLIGHTDRIWSAEYSPDGNRAATASEDRTARIWNATSGQLIVLLNGHTDRVNRASFSPDGERIVTASDDKTARIWDAASGQQLSLLSGHADRVWSAAFSADGGRIVTTSTDRTARVWDTHPSRQLAELKGHTARLWSAAYSADGLRIITSSVDGTARIWDAVSGQPLAVLTGHSDSVNDAHFSPNGSRAVTASDDRTARVWDAATGRQVLTLNGHADRVSSASFSPDGERIVTASLDKTARIWEAASGRELMALRGHTDRVWFAAFSPDGRRIVTTANDNTARIWDAATGRSLLVLNGHDDRVWSAAFSPDGRYVATASEDKTARVWDGTSGQQILVLNGHAGRVVTAQFAPDGRTLVTASDDKTARLWDAANGLPLSVLSGHQDRVQSAGFSPDGRRVVTASFDGTARVWMVETMPIDEQINWAEAALFEPLASAERVALGLPTPPLVRHWPSPATRCDHAAAAPYDPERRDRGVPPAKIVPDIALIACHTPGSPLDEARRIFEEGRAAWAGAQTRRARDELEKALSMHYAAAGIDLAALLTDRAAGMLDVPRALTLYEQGWQDGIPIAAFKLGELYEQGVSLVNDETPLLPANSQQAWAWYTKAAAVGEPNALARFARKADDAAALHDTDDAQKNSLLLEAFGYYARAAEQARRADWPDGLWRSWRYRRASLARVLAHEGMMQDIAVAFARVREGGRP